MTSLRYKVLNLTWIRSLNATSCWAAVAMFSSDSVEDVWHRVKPHVVLLVSRCQYFLQKLNILQDFTAPWQHLQSSNGVRFCRIWYQSDTKCIANIGIANIGNTDILLELRWVCQIAKSKWILHDLLFLPKFWIITIPTWCGWLLNIL